MIHGKFFLDFDRQNLVSNKNGIVISTNDDNGVIDLGVLEETERSTINIDVKREEDGKGSIKILRCQLLQASKVFTVADQLNICRGKKTCDLNEGKSYEFKIYYKSKMVGIHTCPLVFEFEDSCGKVFHIIRFFKGRTKNNEIDEIMPSEPYHKFKPVVTVKDPQIEIIPGIPPLE